MKKVGFQSRQEDKDNLGIVRATVKNEMVRTETKRMTQEGEDEKRRR
jgi:hypothetical protein